ncbi:Leucine-rich repeat-containing protein 56, partial [Frankliniella fusca]
WRRGGLLTLGVLLRHQDAEAGGDAAAAARSWWAADSDEDDDAEDWLALERVLPSVLQHASPDCLPMDHTLPHLLRQVAGMEDLAEVRSIKLRVIGREMSLQRLCVYVPNLTELNLDGSSIGSLRELGCGLSGLRVLRVTRCSLDSLDGTFGLPSLAELYAAFNRVQDIAYLACLPSIEHIDLRGNRVSDIRYAGFLTVCSLLRDLVLAENPCAARPGYRATIREMLPGLSTLDGVPLGCYDQDDDTDTPTEAGEEGETAEEGDQEDDVGAGDGVGDEDTDSEAAEAAAKQQCEAASEAEESTASTSSAGSSSRGREGGEAAVVDASRLWARAQRHAERDIARALLTSRPRPATASCATPRPRGRQGHPPHRGWQASWTERPATAVSCVRTEADADAPGGVGVGDADAPSPLTSGGVVCGNLSLALRAARRRKEAWGGGGGGGGGGWVQAQDPLLQLQQARRGSSSSSGGSGGSASGAFGSCSSLSSSLSAGESTPVESLGSTGAAAGTSSSTPRVDPVVDLQDSSSLVAASRRWRDAYHHYRADNR